jgi:hypothetical protein
MVPKWILERHYGPPIPAWTEFVIFSVFLPLAGSAAFGVPMVRWIWNWNQTGFVLPLKFSACLHRFDFGVSF